MHKQQESRRFVSSWKNGVCILFRRFEHFKRQAWINAKYEKKYLIYSQKGLKLKCKFQAKTDLEHYIVHTYLVRSSVQLSQSGWTTDLSTLKRKHNRRWRFSVFGVCYFILLKQTKDENIIFDSNSCQNHIMSREETTK